MSMKWIGAGVFQTRDRKGNTVVIQQGEEIPEGAINDRRAAQLERLGKIEISKKTVSVPKSKPAAGPKVDDSDDLI